MAKKASNIIKTDATSPKTIITDADYRTWIRDLRAELGVNEGFSESTLRYATRFYELYAPLFSNRQQPVEDFINTNLQQPAEILPDLIRGQLVDDFNNLFSIPWTHHQYIIDKVKGDSHKALFFVKKSLQNQWGRALLLNFLSTATVW